MIVAASAITIAAFILVVYSLVRAHRDVCTSQAATLNVLAAILIDAEQRSMSQHLTDGEGRLLHEFYARQFARIQSARC